MHVSSSSRESERGKRCDGEQQVLQSLALVDAQSKPSTLN
jgi:hypothetical protein